MKSPFLDLPVHETKKYNEWNNNEDEIALKNPLLDPEHIRVSKSEFLWDNSPEDKDDNNHPYSKENYFEGELTTAELNISILKNRSYMKELKWENYLDKIFPVLNLSIPTQKTFLDFYGVPFAKAVYEFQQFPAYGLNPLYKGVLGLSTWSVMQGAIGLHDLDLFNYINFRQAIKDNKTEEKKGTWKSSGRNKIISLLFARKIIDHDLPLDAKYFALGVAKFQKRYFLKVDGVLGPKTFAQLINSNINNTPSISPDDSKNEKNQIETLININKLPAATATFKQRFDFIIANQFGLSVRNLDKHEIGIYQEGPPGPWKPISGFRETLKGRVKHYKVSDSHEWDKNSLGEYQDEYDWNITVELFSVFAKLLNTDLDPVLCEVTPSDQFHNNPWFPPKGSGKPSALLGKDICVYGPWVLDAGDKNNNDGNNGREIHPIDAIWWQDVEGNNDETSLMLVQDAAKGRYRRAEHYDPKAAQDPNWTPWVKYPQKEEIKIPFIYNQQKGEYPIIKIEKKVWLNVDTHIPNGNNRIIHKLILDENKIPIKGLKWELPILAEVIEEPGVGSDLSAGQNLRIDFSDVSITGAGPIIGYVRILADIGDRTSKEEGILVLKIRYSKGIDVSGLRLVED